MSGDKLIDAGHSIQFAIVLVVLVLLIGKARRKTLRFRFSALLAWVILLSLASETIFWFFEGRAIIGLIPLLIWMLNVSIANGLIRKSQYIEVSDVLRGVWVGFFLWLIVEGVVINVAMH